MKFSEKGAGGGGQRPFGNFPEIHPFSGRQASLIRGGFKCHMFLKVILTRGRYTAARAAKNENIQDE